MGMRSAWRIVLVERVGRLSALAALSVILGSTAVVCLVLGRGAVSPGVRGSGGSFGGRGIPCLMFLGWRGLGRISGVL